MSKLHSLWLNNILLCVYVTFCLLINFVNGLLGYFHLLAIMNDAAMNTDVQVSESCFQFSWIHTPRSEIAGSSGCSLVRFLRNFAKVFFTGAVPVHIAKYIA